MDVHLTRHVDAYLSFVIMLVAVAAAWLPRWLAVARFRQDWRSALLHPFGILILLAVQWYSLARKLRGGAVSWRGRAYAAASEGPEKSTDSL